MGYEMIKNSIAAILLANPNIWSSEKTLFRILNCWSMSTDYSETLSFLKESLNRLKKLYPEAHHPSWQEVEHWSENRARAELAYIFAEELLHKYKAKKTRLSRQSKTLAGNQYTKSEVSSLSVDDIINDLKRMDIPMAIDSMTEGTIIWAFQVDDRQIVEDASQSKRYQLDWNKEDLLDYLIVGLYGGIIEAQPPSNV